MEPASFPRDKPTATDFTAVIQAACGPNSTKADLDALLEHLDSKAPLESKLLLLDAARHSILDPAHLLAEPHDGNMNDIERAWAVLYALGNENDPILGLIDDTAAADIWTRMWPWLQFIDNHRSKLPFLPSEPLDSERLLDETFLAIVTALILCAKRTHFVSGSQLAQPGVLCRLIRAWRYIHTMTPLKRAHDAQMTLFRFLAASNFFSDAQKAEIRAGAGGTDDDVAHLAMLHFAKNIELLKSSSEYDNRTGASTFSMLICFMNNYEPPPKEVPVVIEQPAFWAAVCARGFLPLVSKYLLIYARRDKSKSVLSRMDSRIDRALSLVVLIFFMPPGHLRIPEAVEHRLLEAVLRLHDSDSTHLKVQLILETIFPAHLVRVAVLRAFKAPGILEAAEKSAANPAFRKSGLFKYWVAFRDVLDARLALLDRCEAGEFPAFKMCDNTQCAHHAQEAEFKRCSGCHSTIYCSTACQKTDWTVGGHKKGCGALRSLHIRNAALDLTPADRDFIRVLMDVDNTLHRDEIMTESIELLACRELHGELITYHDYAKGAVDLVVSTHTMVSMQPLPLASQAITRFAGTDTAWREVVRRAETSAGRFAIDVAIFFVGAERAFWIVPRRVVVSDSDSERMPKMMRLRRLAEEATVSMRSEQVVELLEKSSGDDDDDSEGLEFHQL
ncbi:hypothetical protein C8F01DRAFT_1126400 [Mycena amicta]|nr:hypothetical protein C8F01DRAFT_1126400 [Mycena amicta]